VRNQTTSLIFWGGVATIFILSAGWVEGLLFETIVLSGGLALLAILYRMWRVNASLPADPPAPTPSVEGSSERTPTADIPSWQQPPHQQTPQEVLDLRERDVLLIQICGVLGVYPDSADLVDIVEKRQQKLKLDYDLVCSDLADKEDCANQLEIYINQLGADLDNLRNVTVEKDESMRRLYGQVQELEAELNDLRQELAAAESLTAAAEGDEADSGADSAKEFRDLALLMQETNDRHEAEVAQFHAQIAAIEVDLEEARRERDEATGKLVQTKDELCEELDSSHKLRVEVDSLRDQLKENGIDLPPRAASSTGVSLPTDLPDDGEEEQAEVEESQVEGEEGEPVTGLIPRPEDIPSPPPFGADAEGEPELVRPSDEAGPDEPTKTVENPVVDADSWGGGISGGWDTDAFIRKYSNEEKKK